MISRPRLPLLSDTLGSLLPDGRDALLLRACLGDAATTAQAWNAWLAMTSGLPAALVERPQSRRFLPLLHHGLASHGITVAEPSLSILRAATLWEERRAAHIRRILVELLACLRRAGVAVVLLKGAAVAETAYPQFRLRHCHDLDLLIEAASFPEAHAALVAAGFHPATAAGRESNGSTLAMKHQDGLTVKLHSRLWAARANDDPQTSFRRRARPIDIDGENVPVFAPKDMLLHVCGHAGMAAGSGNWAWLADAAMILRRHQLAAEDWIGLVRIATEAGIAVQLAVRLDDLADRFGLPIPQVALDPLIEAAWRSSSAERDAAISAARAASGMRFVGMLKRSGWRSRLEISRWALRRSPRLIGLRRTT